MSTRLIASRYAKGLLRACNHHVPDAENSLTVLERVKDLFDLLEVRKILLSPVMANDLKIVLLEYALNLGSKDAFADSTVRLLVKDDRIGLLPEVVLALRHQINGLNAIKEGCITSAALLDGNVLDEIKSSLEKIFSTKINLETKVDPNLLGGIIIAVGNKVIDLSLKHEIDQMFSTLAKA